MSDPLIHAISHWSTYLGYCVHAREFFRRVMTQVPMIGTEWQQNSTIFRDADVLRDRSLATKHFGDRTLVSIGLSLGSAFYILRDAPGPRIGYTVWDSTWIPSHWLGPLGMVDRVWVPSEWARRVMIDHGIAPESVEVIPEGVDHEVFKPGLPGFANITGLPGFKFINVGKFEERKATGRMIQEFDAEFANEDDVWLVLSCHNHFVKGFSIRDELRALGLKHPEKLVYIPPLPSHGHMARLYNSCHAFLGASRAEGWGLCHIEAAACGLPLITTNYSAPAEWAAGHAYFCDHGMVEIPEIQHIRPDNGWYGTWADPDWGQFRRHMRHLYENRDEAAAAGRALSEHVRTEYSWDRAGEKGVTAVREVAG